MEVKDIISSGFLELYISGLTTAEETRKVEEWVLIYPAVKDELNSIQDAIESYALDLAIQPDASIKNKILSRIEDTSGNSAIKIIGKVKPFEPTSIKNHNPIVKTIPVYYKYAAAASIILLIVSAVIGYNFYTKYKEANEQLQVAQQKLQQEIQLGQAMHTDLDVMSNKYSHPVVLNGTPHSPDAVAKIYWMKDKGGEVWVDPSYLPEIPTDKQYQLWAIIDGKPVDAGMISINKGTYHIQKMKSFGNVQAFAITMEKTGGSPTPDMDAMVVMSKI